MPYMDPMGKEQCWNIMEFANTFDLCSFDCNCHIWSWRSQIRSLDEGMKHNTRVLGRSASKKTRVFFFFEEKNPGRTEEPEIVDLTNKQVCMTLFACRCNVGIIRCYPALVMMEAYHKSFERNPDWMKQHGMFNSHDSFFIIFWNLHFEIAWTTTNDRKRNGAAATELSSRIRRKSTTKRKRHVNTDQLIAR